MKKVLLIVNLILFAFFSYAQDDVTIPELPDVKDIKTDVVIHDTASSRWVVTGVTGLNSSQTYLNNWSAGGENNFTGNLYAKVNANYVKGRIAWGSALNTQYGKAWSETNDWYKSVDNLNLSTKFGVTSMNSHKLYWTALADFKTQYDKGYTNIDDPDSAYISMTLNFGLKYDDRIQLKDKDGNLIGPRVQIKEMLGLGIAYNF